MLQADNLRGIDPYSRKVYYLDDPVHLLVSCIEVVTNYELRLEHQVVGAITRDHNFVHQGPYVITSVSLYGYVELQDIDSDKKFIVNGQRIKHYLEGNFE